MILNKNKLDFYLNKNNKIIKIVEHDNATNQLIK
jgi:hypothetical protein